MSCKKHQDRDFPSNPCLEENFRSLFWATPSRFQCILDIKVIISDHMWKLECFRGQFPSTQKVFTHFQQNPAPVHFGHMLHKPLQTKEIFKWGKYCSFSCTLHTDLVHRCMFWRILPQTEGSFSLSQEGRCFQSSSENGSPRMSPNSISAKYCDLLQALLVICLTIFSERAPCMT